MVTRSADLDQARSDHDCADHRHDRRGHGRSPRQGSSGEQRRPRPDARRAVGRGRWVGARAAGRARDRRPAAEGVDAPTSNASRTSTRAQHQQTDQANTEYRQSRSTLADIPPNLRALLDSIEGQLGDLPVMRSEVDAAEQDSAQRRARPVRRRHHRPAGHPRPVRPAGWRHHADRPPADRRRRGHERRSSWPRNGWWCWRRS